MNLRVFILLLIMPVLAFSKDNLSYGVIKGRIINSQNQSVFGATILLKNKKISAISNQNGEYVLSNIPRGVHTLWISFLGFETFHKQITIDKDHKIVSLNITLKELSNKLKEVVLHGKTKKRSIETEGFAVNAVEMKDIKAQSIQVTEVLDQNAGTRLRQNGGLGSHIDFNINGLSGNAVRVFIDGIPIENYGPSFSLASLPSNLIKRVEIYKGVVPIKFGGDALGGAINVVLNNNKKTSLNASYSYGSFNTHQASLDGSFRDKKTGFTVKGSGFYNYSDNNYKVWGDQVYIVPDVTTGDIEHIVAKRFHDTFESKGTKIDIGYTDVKRADEFLLGAIVSNLKKDIQHGQTMENVFGNRKVAQETFVVDGVYKKKNFLTKGLEVDVYGSYSKLTRKLIDTSALKYNWKGKLTPDVFDISPGPYLENLSGAEGSSPSLNKNFEDTFTFRSNISYKINKNNTISTSFLANNFKRSNYDAVKRIDIRELDDTQLSKKQILGVNYELNAFDKKLKTNVFFKYYNQRIKREEPVIGNNDEIEIETTRVSAKNNGYGFTLSYQISPGFQIMTSGEVATRLPNGLELFGNVVNNLYANPDLRPEESENLNVGANIGPFYIKKHSLGFNFNLFYRNTKGKIKRRPPNSTAAVSDFEDSNIADDLAVYVNFESFLAQGFDTDFFYSYDKKLNFKLGVSLFNSRFNTQFNESGARYSFYREREANAPYFTLNANTNYRFKNFIQKKSSTTLYHNFSNVNQFLVGWPGRGGVNKAFVPTQLIHSLGMSYVFPNQKTTLAFDAKNIFNKQVFDNFALQKPGRAFYAKLTLKII